MITDTDILEAMRCYGGSFVNALAKAAGYADARNFETIKAAFSNLWDDYREIAELHAARAEQDRAIRAAQEKL